MTCQACAAQDGINQGRCRCRCHGIISVRDEVRYGADGKWYCTGPGCTKGYDDMMSARTCCPP